MGIDFLVPNIKRDRKRARKQMIKFLTKLDDKGVRKETKRRFPAPKKSAKVSSKIAEVQSSVVPFLCPH